VVVAVPADRLVADQLGPAQHLEVFGHGRAAQAAASA
jgi:hypothetical protein